MSKWDELAYATASTLLVLSPIILVVCLKGCEREPKEEARTKAEQQTTRPSQRSSHISTTEEDAPKVEAKPTPHAHTPSHHPESEPTTLSSDDETTGAAEDYPFEHIPEPATSSLLAVGCVCLLARRRRIRSR